jgi:hypothetical protein
MTPAASQLLTQTQKASKRKAAKRATEQVNVLTTANEAIRNHIALIALKHKCQLPHYKNFKKCYFALGISGYLPLSNRALTA